jgi:hypothetical protein
MVALVRRIVAVSLAVIQALKTVIPCTKSLSSN